SSNPARRARWAPAGGPPTRAFPRDLRMRPPAKANLTASPPAKPMLVLRGMAVSPGIAVGPVAVVDPRGLYLPPPATSPDAVDTELARLARGLKEAKAAAAQDEADARVRLGPQYADILGAHCRMIADPTLYGEARELIEEHYVSAEHAIAQVLERHAT